MNVSDLPKEVLSPSAGVRRGRIAKEIAMKLLPKCKDAGASVIEWEGMKIEVRSKVALVNRGFFDVRSKGADAFLLVFFSLKDDEVYTFFVPPHANARLHLTESRPKWEEFKVTSTKNIRKIIAEHRI